MHIRSVRTFVVRSVRTLSSALFPSLLFWSIFFLQLLSPKFEVLSSSGVA
jgi:hypothetical protein